MDKIKKLLVPKYIIPAVIIFVLLLIYAAGGIYYSSHFLPGTSINGRDYSNQNMDYVKSDVEKPLITKITLLGKDSKEEIIDLSLADVKEIVSDDELKAINNSQNPLIWFTGMSGEKPYTLSSTVGYDETKLEGVVQKLDMISGKDVVAPENAQVTLGLSGYDLIEEQDGNTLDIGKLREGLATTIIGKSDMLDLVATDAYLKPEITTESPEIEAVMEQIEPFMEMVLTYDFGDRQEVLDYSIMGEWITLEKDTGLAVDERKVAAYIQRLATKYDTLRTQRHFKTSNGNEITVGGGIYGWQINLEKSTKELLEHIKAAESKTVKPVYTTYGLARGENDIGNTYIEIDLTTQHMWHYRNGALFIDTGVVTGLPGGKRETPTGVFAVWSKETKRYLSGEDYKLWVEYWMPIDWTGVGIHDATWQPVFGGDNYLYRGSHGCINTPRGIVSQMFENIVEGTPVIIYKS